jgi:hypothetical protein
LLFVAALVVVAYSVEDSASVKMLGDERPTLKNGGADTHPPATGGGVGTGYFNTINNFPGPKHGLPGYKESHNWEEDIDVMSPLVFDYRMYRALIHEKVADAAEMSEEALKTHWMNAVEGKKYDKCPQGHIWFSANEYYELHKESNELAMGGSACKLIMKVYLEKGVFSGAAKAKHQAALPTGAKKFATFGTKLFDGVNQKTATISKSYFEVKNGLYFRTPEPNAAKVDNTFSPARHLTLAFWLQIAPQAKAPNAELFTYGGKEYDNYMRTGFGCVTKDISDTDDTKCYFIMVFQQISRTEYFHTYAEENFKPTRIAFMDNKWAHVLIMLTTRNPGFVPDVNPGEGCPNNQLLGGNVCYGSLHLWVNKKELGLVDWNDGTDTTYAKAWNDAVVSRIWEKKMDKVEGLLVERRFFVSPIQSKEGATLNAFGEINMNNIMWAFPWQGSYKAGIWFCDMTVVSSGNGGFGNAARREIARDAFFDIMSETKALACAHSSNGDAPVTNDDTGGMNN